MTDTSTVTGPAATVTATRHTVNCVPEEFPDADCFAISVSYRGRGLWWVHRGEHRSLGADGTWSWGFRWSAGDREPTTEAEWDSYHTEAEQWTAEHRFDEKTAIALAKAAAPHMTVNGHTVTEALADAAEYARSKEKTTDA